MKQTQSQSQKHYFSAFPYFSPQQRKQILKCTDSMLKGEQKLSMGNAVSAFEKAFSSYCGCQYGIATNSCTSALEVVFKELGLGKNDEVLVPTQTFFANASSVLNSGAKLALVDTDVNFMLSLNALKKAITPYTKAIVIVHFAGLISAEIFDIAAFCKARHITLIEDCSHAHGAIALDSKGRAHKAGSIGDIAVFSFFATKILTCGEGGMILCNNESFATACRARANRGLRPQVQDEEFITLGGNYRMAEFNAILGLSGLENLESFLHYRNKLAKAYKDGLKTLADSGILGFQQIPQGFRHSFWRFIVFLHTHCAKDVIAELKRYHIHADAPYQPLLHKQPLLQTSQVRFHALEQLTPQNHISLPLHNALKLSDVKFIAKTLKAILHSG